MSAEQPHFKVKILQCFKIIKFEREKKTIFVAIFGLVSKKCGKINY